MEENKGVAAQCGLCATEGLDTGGKPGAENGVCATSETAADCRRIVSCGLRTAGRQSTERRLRASGRLHVQDRLRAVNEPRAASAYAPHCDQCRKPILRLETYITVGCVTLCDGCYMNMGTVEFLSKIGGELRVME